ncbi:hypothetical protein [Pedobacter sp. L105]|uniref:hypothetical protein n=1 Tax=Pedobacter sp. L105 TaxID=1641871 RepID=UPI00131D6DE0|nr:hypothetical protein [Pedobacter sp. L105]
MILKFPDIIYHPAHGQTEIYPEQTNEQKMEAYLQNITTNCRWIIKSLFYLQFPIELLMETMGWKNKHAAHNQKYKCVQLILREMLKQENRECLAPTV